MKNKNSAASENGTALVVTVAKIGMNTSAAGGPFRRTSRGKAMTAPAPKSTASSFTPIAFNTTATTPSAASQRVFTAVRARLHKACTITATMTGFTPDSSRAASGSTPNLTYAAAMTPTMTATSSPGQPARRCPTWIASSVEFGPGMRFVAPSKSRNSACVSQPRSRTISRSMIATCAAGPPSAVQPSLRKSAATSRSGRFGIAAL